MCEKANADEEPRYCGSIWVVRKSNMPTLEAKSFALSARPCVQAFDWALSGSLHEVTERGVCEESEGSRWSRPSRLATRSSSHSTWLRGRCLLVWGSWTRQAVEVDEPPASYVSYHFTGVSPLQVPVLLQLPQAGIPSSHCRRRSTFALDGIRQGTRSTFILRTFSFLSLQFMHA